MKNLTIAQLESEILVLNAKYDLLEIRRKETASIWERNTYLAMQNNVSSSIAELQQLITKRAA